MDLNASVPLRRWLPWSITIPLLTVLVTAAVMAIPPDTGGIDIASGREKFVVHCGSCHFTRSDMPAHHGPNLHDIGKTAASRLPGRSAADYILESIVDPAAYVAPGSRPGMPAHVARELDPEDIRDLIGFLASRGAAPDYDEIRRLEIPDRRTFQTPPSTVRLTDMQLAEKALRETGGCLNCHSIYSRPENQVFAPPLFAVGIGDEASLRESLTNPDKEVRHPYRSVVVTMDDGRLVSGQLMARNDQRLLLCLRDDANRLQLREIPLERIDSEGGQPAIRESATSPMPSGLDELLTGKEIEALITLIRQLN
jgi:cytochrome c2